MEISIRNVYKSFGSKEVLSDVSIDVEKGSIFGLIGPSGCGKTTLVKIVMGLLPFEKGEVKVAGHVVPDPKVIERMGYMAQAAALYPTLNGWKNLEFFGKLYGLKGSELNQRIDHVASLVKLTDDLGKKVQNYSGGMKQRLSLATALIHQPDILILDEPTVGIDPVLRHEIWKELRQLANEGAVILITTHVMDEAGKCDRLAMLRYGKVLAIGTADELIKNSGARDFEEAFIIYGGDSHEK